MEKTIPQYLTESQVSQMTGIALSTLRNNRFMRKGISYLKIGKKTVRYELNTVISYCEKCKIKTMED